MKRLLSVLLILCMALAMFPQNSASAVEITLLGDVDLDNYVNSSDAAAILRYIVHFTTLNEQAICNSDVNGDSVTTAADASAILRYVVKLDTLPPSAPEVSMPPVVPKVTFLSPTLTLSLDSVSTLRYVANVDPLPTITWSSSDSDIATVDEGGTVNTVGVGTAEIFAAVEGGSTTKCTIIVENKIKSIIFDNRSFPSNGSIIAYQGDTVAFDGGVYSDEPLLSIECKIYDLLGGNVEQSATATFLTSANTKIVSLSDVMPSGIAQSTLTIGSKRVTLICTNTAETITLVDSYFSVSDFSSSISPELIASSISDGVYYGLYSANATWTQANDWTIRNGGTLATVASAKENNAITGLISSVGQPCWLGASNDGQQWSWVKNEAFSYENWADNQPQGGSCLSTDASGKWAALDISDTTDYFVLESPLSSLSVELRKTQFSVGASFVPSRHIAVFVRFANGYTIQVTDFELSDTTLSVAGDKRIVVTYGGRNVAFYVTVSDDPQLSGTGFEQCKYHPLPVDYEQLEHNQQFNLHGTVHSDHPILSVTLTIINEDISGSSPYKTTITFTQADERLEYALNEDAYFDAAKNQWRSLDDMVEFKTLKQGRHSMTLQITTSESATPIVIADGSFKIVDTNGQIQLSFRQFSHCYEGVEEFFNYDTEKYLFYYKWAKEVYPNDTRYSDRDIIIDPVWMSNNLMRLTTFGGKNLSSSYRYANVAAAQQFSDADKCIVQSYVRVHGTNGDTGVVQLTTLLAAMSGPQVSRFQSDLKDISQHALGIAIDINADMDVNKNSYANKAKIINDVSQNLVYNGLLSDGTHTYYDFTYSGSYSDKYNGVPKTCINYLLYELAFYRAGFRWGLYFSHTSDAMHYSLTESSLEAHEPQEGGLRQVYEYVPIAGIQD